MPRTFELITRRARRRKLRKLAVPVASAAIANAQAKVENAQARMELRGFAEEQAVLRRVAALVARTAAEDVFAAVAEESGRLLNAYHATMSRYGPDGAIRVLASWSSTGAALPIGSRWSLGGQNLHTMVFQTGQVARLDDYTDASGPARPGVAVVVSVPGICRTIDYLPTLLARAR
ncbi:MAG TPA: hypothetical protein VF070_36540 [Streptosporangiaceae bacterium]